jgi:hypothetical protein
LCGERNYAIALRVNLDMDRPGHLLSKDGGRHQFVSLFQPALEVRRGSICDFIRRLPLVGNSIDSGYRQLRSARY